MQERKTKVEYYLDLAQEIASRSTCIRRKYGAVLVNNDQIIATGYNGAPRGRQNCCDSGSCLREKLNIPRGQRYEVCRSVHAEANCIVTAARKDMIGAVMYLTGVEKDGSIVPKSSPCSMCKRLIINAGIEAVVVRDIGGTYETYNVVSEWVEGESEEQEVGY